MMKVTNIERGTLSVEFEVWELPMIATLGRLAEKQAYGGDSPDHECTDTIGMYASLFTAFCEVAEMAARLSVDSGEPLTLQEYRASHLYYQGHTYRNNGAKMVQAAQEEYPDVTAALERLAPTSDDEAGGAA